MKKALVALSAFAVLTSALSALDTSFNNYKDKFDVVSRDFAKVLPFNSTIGLQWSDAYIGQLINLPPHFGVGVSYGMTGIPLNDVKPILDGLGISLPSQISSLANVFGFPIPSVVAELRIGGIFLPFDFGIKGMILPDAIRSQLKTSTGTDIDDKIFGGEIRVPILKEGLFIPAISVGVGYTHSEGSIGMSIPNAPTFRYDFQLNPNDPSTFHSITTTRPAMKFDWISDSFDIKAQVSKTILFVFTPYLGAGVTFGKSTAGGGLSSQIQDNGVNVSNASQLNSLLAQYSQLTGIQVPSVDPTGIFFRQTINGTAFRVFGGLSLNLFIFRFDFSGMYNISGGNVGLQGNLRIQL